MSCGRRLIDAARVYAGHRHNRSTTSWNLILSGYAKSGHVDMAEKLFDEMPDRDVVSWNAMLAGYKRTGDSVKAFRLFLRMVRTGLRPTGSTLATVITSAPNTSMATPQLHAVAIRAALNSNTFVGTALIGGYARLGDPVALDRVFDEIPIKNPVSWTALIMGYMELGHVTEAWRAFRSTPAKNVVTWTAMVDGLNRNGDLDEARRCFDQMPERNVVAWTAMIKGYERGGRFADALDLFVEMRRSSSARPNQFTYSAAVSASAGCCSLLMGQAIHADVLRSGAPPDVVLSSSLVEMYGRCGDVDSAIRAFESIGARNLVSWNSMIACYARHGLPVRAMEGFERMTRGEGIRPDQVTFVCILTACAHGGLVEEGERYFESMEREHGIRPAMEHYGCMADLLARSGQLDKAERLVMGMPFEPDALVWGALVGGCALHSSLEHGWLAAESLQRLEKDHPAIYSMMLRVYSDEGRWGEVDELKRFMEAAGVRKRTGTSCVECPSLHPG